MHKKIILLLLITIFSLGAYWILYLQKAHSTFTDYYNFRNCVELIEKQDSFGTCRLANGQIIKIVLYKEKWYLDGDLPNGWF